MLTREIAYNECQTWEKYCLRRSSIKFFDIFFALLSLSFRSQFKDCIRLFATIEKFHFSNHRKYKYFVEMKNKSEKKSFFLPTMLKVILKLTMDCNSSIIWENSNSSTTLEVPSKIQFLPPNYTCSQQRVTMNNLFWLNINLFFPMNCT